MRIMHVGRASLSSHNGVHQSIHTLATLARDHGHTGAAVRFSRSVRSPQHTEVDGIDQYTLPVLGLPGPAGAFLQALPPASRAALRGLLSHTDVLHLHSVFQVDHTFVRNGGVPFVVTPHGGYHPRVLERTNPRRKKVWGAVFDRRILAEAAYVQALTRREAEQVATLQPHATTQVLPIPVLGLARDNARGPRPAGPVVFMGRLDIDHKGLDLLLEAWALTVGLWGPEVDLVIAGPGDKHTFEQLADLAQRLAVSDRVRLVGPVTGQAKADLLAGAGWFVHTSRREGLPLSMVEAAAHAAPLLATVETNLGDLITHHGAGLVSGQDVTDIADMFRRAAAMSAAEYARHSGGAVALAEGFRPEELWPRYERMYEEAAHARA